MKKMAFLLVMTLLVGMGSVGRAATYIVTTGSDTDCADFDCDLQSALNAASLNSEGDIINIQPGTYDASGSTFGWNTLKNFPLTINGAGAGVTIINGAGTSQGMIIFTDNISGGDSNAHITVRNLSFQNGDSVPFRGGGLWVFTIEANITIEGCIFGGGNAASGGGASVETNSGIISLLNNTFSGNSASNFQGGGVAVISGAGGVTIRANAFINNDSGFNGGGIYVSTDSGFVTLSNNTLSANRSDTNGGGAVLVTDFGAVTVTNNTLTGNTSGFGGGVQISLNDNTSTANIYNNIVWDNSATNVGADIYACDNCTGATTGAAVKLYNNDFSDFHSLCQATPGCTETLSTANNIDADPLFVNPGSGDYHLQSTSACIDAGTNAAPGLPSTDFENNARVIDGDKDGTATVDIGADEYRSYSPNAMLLLLLQ